MRKDETERERCFVFVHMCECMCAKGSVIVNEGIIDYTVLSLAKGWLVGHTFA